jgi:two-component system NtrC family sensor kinase
MKRQTTRSSLKQTRMAATRPWVFVRGLAVGRVGNCAYLSPSIQAHPVGVIDAGHLMRTALQYYQSSITTPFLYLDRSVAGRRARATERCDRLGVLRRGAMRRLVNRLAGFRLQTTLVILFSLLTLLTVGVTALVTSKLIGDYLSDAQDRRVNRDMQLAEAFYEIKLEKIGSTARRLASSGPVVRALPQTELGDAEALEALQEAVENEIRAQSLTASHFIVLVDAEGHAVLGRTSRSPGQALEAQPGSWASLPIVGASLATGGFFTATEVIPADLLATVGLAEQARITIVDTPKAAPEPFDPREGTAGLTLTAVAPVVGAQGSVEGAVIVGHLFNNDFTIVDRIKEVAGVDTVTIFFGDLRVSTNVLDGQGKRAVGTRVSQEVLDVVLVKGLGFTGPAYVVNENFITRYEPLRNYEGQIVGILYVGARQASFLSLVNEFDARILLIALASTLVAVMVAIPMSRSITKPVETLAEATERVARGDRTVMVPTRGAGELAVLTESFNSMVETLRTTEQQLIQSEKLASVGQLAAGVAHEINNPLGTILLFSDILRKELPPDDARRDDVKMIMDEAARCKTIVSDLLNFARQNEVLAQPTDTNSLLRDTMNEIKVQPIFEHVEILSDLDPALPSIQADPAQLKEVFINLMTNAAEAMESGGSLTITSDTVDDDTIKIAFQDTGCGIPEENLSKIFTPFFTTKPIGKGTGLGLAIVYGIIKMHRGQIYVDSEVGVGSTFSITLPVRLPAAQTDQV